ncbi:MAG: glycosyltransferase family 4 protein [Planctomycetota bacterium]|jgi:glycosyltransferase involved in cell wall biosynthesis
MIKILYLLTEAGSGGAERVVLDLASSLDPKKFSIYAAALDGRGIYAERFRRHGIPFFDLQSYKSVLQLPFKFRRLTAEIKPDVVHSHLFHANLIAKTGLIGRPERILTTCHIAEKRNLPLRYIADRLTAFLAEKEICVSNAVKKHQISKTGLKDKHFKVIYNGIDCSKFNRTFDTNKQKEKFNIPDSCPVVGFLGRFSYQKGADIFVKSLGEKILQENNFYSVIAGYGSEESSLYALAESLPKDRKPLFTGQIDKPEEFLPLLDICVIPSRWEGFGLIAVEAMAAGCRVIASDVDSLPEIISNGTNGLLFTPENHIELAECIHRLLNDKQACSSMLEASKATAEKFNIDKMSDNYQNIYHELSDPFCNGASKT